MSDQPYSEPGITEETRQMYPDNYSDKMGATFQNLIDEIVRPYHVKPKYRDQTILIEELTIIHDAHVIKDDEQDQWVAAVLRAAIKVLASL
jgi:hypothetical protein